eukprot:m.58582 g.58582  ORF g.58582 m.58582 type:complete len:1166 (-) comp7871_c0_seq1:324-3821(-)
MHLSALAVAVVALVAVGSAFGDEMDIIGCQGIVSSPVPLTFDDVEIVLKKDGQQLQQTEVSPHDGYYFLPLDTIGSYTVEINAPSHWNFVPKKVAVNFDGERDLCSLGQDISFTFVGINVTGQVRVEGTTQGPSNVNVGLFLQDSEEAETQAAVVTTNHLGEFTFPHVLPGEYTVRALETAWSFSKSSENVVVDFSSSSHATLVISGYDIVVNLVNDDGAPAKGVVVFIASESDHETCPHLQHSPQPKVQSIDKIWCSESSDDKGVVTFRGVNPGKHNILPLFVDPQGESYVITPSHKEVEVANENLHIPEPFSLEGIFVSVLVMSEIGEALPGASVALTTLSDGHGMDAISDSFGLASFSHVPSGSFKIIASHNDDLEFQPLQVAVNSASNSFSISPALIKVCGSLKAGLMTVGFPVALNDVEVSAFVSSKDANAHASTTTTTNAEGNFCFMLPPRSSVKITVHPDASVYWSPSEIVAPVLELYSGKTLLIFDQALGTIQGVVSCLDTCPDDLFISISSSHAAAPIQSTASSSQGHLATSQKKKVNAIVNENGDAVFAINGLGLQSYSVWVSKAEWCFNPKSVEVLVHSDHMFINGSPIESVGFSQKGFTLHITSTHEMDVSISHDGHDGEVVSISQGKSRVCLQSSGLYSITPLTQYKLEKEKYTFDTNLPEPIVLNVQSIKYTGTVQLPTTCPSILVNVKVVSEGGDNKSMVSPSFERSTNGMFTYTFPIVVPRGATVDVSVTGCEDLYISPHSIQVPFPVTRDSEAEQPSILFSGREGAKVSVSVQPPISNVDVSLSLTCEDGEGTASLSDVTNEKGIVEFRVLDENCAMVASASKQGYNFVQDDETPLLFHATELSSLQIIATYLNGAPAKGVVMTASGGSFRKTRASDENGSVMLKDLEPAQYFVKPLLKDHALDPPSQSVDVRAGENKIISFTARKTLFSISGSISSLGGGFVGNVNVFIIGEDGSVFETTTGEDGNFNFPGLRSPSRYSIQCVTSTGSHEFQPATQSITVNEEDVVDVVFVAVKNTRQCIISGRVQSPEGVYLGGVRLELVDASTGSTIATARPFPGNYFEFNNLPQQQYSEPLVIRASTFNWFAQIDVQNCNTRTHIIVEGGNIGEEMMDKETTKTKFSFSTVLPAIVAAALVTLFVTNAKLVGLK